MSVTALDTRPRRRAGLRWTAFLNLLVVATLAVFGAFAWLVLLVTGGAAGRRSGHLRVIIEANDGEGGPVRLNFRVPLNVLRAGVRLAIRMPSYVRTRVNDALRRQGLDLDIAKLNPEDFDELVDALRDTSVDIAQEREDVSVRIFSE